MNTSWYEVWADEAQAVPYLLLLRPCDAGFEVLDPAEGSRRVFLASNYNEARIWLLEDEFVQVGRKEVDDP